MSKLRRGVSQLEEGLPSKQEAWVQSHHHVNWSWWRTAIIPAFWRWRRKGWLNKELELEGQSSEHESLQHRKINDGYV